MMKILALLCIYCALTFTQAANPLLIGAFNVQVFGKSKMNEEDVVNVLVEVNNNVNYLNNTCVS